MDDSPKDGVDLYQLEYYVISDNYRDYGTKNSEWDFDTNKSNPYVNNSSRKEKGILMDNITEFNISVLDITAPFSVFERYGFSSGRDGSKFGGVNFKRSSNGLIYLPDNTAAFLSCRTESETDLGTHTLFIAEVTDAGVLSAEQPMTYAYYHANVKPKPAETKSGKTGWRCKICGYIYEGEVLPDDFICPLCKHPASDFEKIQY